MGATAAELERTTLGLLTESEQTMAEVEADLREIALAAALLEACLQRLYRDVSAAD